MHKIIILSFITFINSLNCMNQNNVFTAISEHPDLLWKLTEQLCVITERHKSQTPYFKNLACINRFYFYYYTNEKIQQNIIDFLITDRKYSLDIRRSNSLYAARFLQFNLVAKKIDALHKKVSDPQELFFSDDLEEKNTWYLNSTSTINGATPVSLWDHIIKKHDVEKARLFIEKHYIKLSSCAIKTLIDNIAPEDSLKANFEICNILLSKITLDQRNRCQNDTELIMAAKKNLKEIARLLLAKGANPYLLYSCLEVPYSAYNTYDHINQIPKDSRLENAFTLEKGEPKGWLMTMYKDIQKSKSLEK